MKFREKIGKVMEASRLSISSFDIPHLTSIALIGKVMEASRLSISAIEVKCGISNATLRGAMDDDRFPTDKIVERLILGLGIDRKWWETGAGEVFNTGDHQIEKKTNIGTNDHKDEIISLYRRLNEKIEEIAQLKLDILGLQQQVKDIGVTKQYFETGRDQFRKEAEALKEKIREYEGIVKHYESIVENKEIHISDDDNRIEHLLGEVSKAEKEKGESNT